MGQFNEASASVIEGTVITVPSGVVTKHVLTVPLKGIIGAGVVHAVSVKSSVGAVATKVYVRSKSGDVACALLDFEVPAYTAGDTTTIDTVGYVQLVQGLFAAGGDAELVFIPVSAPASSYTLTVSVWRI